MTAAHVAAHGLEGVELTLVTPEDRPLALFGGDASDAVAALLAEAGIEVRTGAYPVAFGDGHLAVLPDGGVAADRVVALPRLYVPPLGGVPQTYEGFIPVDAHGRVVGLPGVWAAGDATSFPVKQGGIAAQQADTAAESIAAAAGVPVQPLPFRPVLRGLLLTGDAPRFLRGEPVARGEESLVSTEPLWWPPAKIVGRHLAPFLAGLEPVAAATERAPAGAVAIEIPLDEAELMPPSAPALARVPHEPCAGDACSPGQVVAPADTVADVAERLLARRHDAALVVEGDELIGIVTSSDLLRAMAGRIRCGEATVREWMTAEPVVVDVDAGVAEAAALMARTGLSRLVVVDGGAAGRDGDEGAARTPWRSGGGRPRLLGLGDPLRSAKEQPPRQPAERPDDEPVTAERTAGRLVRERDPRLGDQPARLGTEGHRHARPAGLRKRDRVDVAAQPLRQPPRPTDPDQHELAVRLLRRDDEATALHQPDERPVAHVRRQPARDQERPRGRDVAQSHLARGGERCARAARPRRSRAAPRSATPA